MLAVSAPFTSEAKESPMCITSKNRRSHRYALFLRLAGWFTFIEISIYIFIKESNPKKHTTKMVPVNAIVLNTL